MNPCCMSARGGWWALLAVALLSLGSGALAWVLDKPQLPPGVADPQLPEQDEWRASEAQQIEWVATFPWELYLTPQPGGRNPHRNWAERNQQDQP